MASVSGWFNWYVNRGRMPLFDTKEIAKTRRMVSNRRAL